MSTEQTPYTHISQPPHTAGKVYNGLRSRIDSEQIPSPVEAALTDAEQWQGRPYLTLPGGHPPLSTTDYVGIDQGNSLPRFIRSTAWHIPNSSELAESCEIPLAVVVQPFAELHEGEEEVPLVDFGESGPPRCESCRGYINPWCTFDSGGTRWRCNLCKHETEVSAEYFCHLDANLLRADHMQRAELNKGTVDFTVPAAYHAPHASPRIASQYHSPAPPPKPSSSRTPEPMRVLFAIDVSIDALSWGKVAVACTAIKGALYGGEMGDGTRMEACFPAGCKVALMTYDSSVHFYDLSPDRDQAAMLVVPDIDDEMFCPLYDRAFVDPLASRNVIEGLLDSLQTLFLASHQPTSALGAAMRGALAALAGRGGQAIFFQTSPCSIGPGVHTSVSSESSLYDTDNEKTLFLPKDDIWQELGEECAEEGIGVSLFIGTSQNHHVDTASIGIVATLTGGQIYYRPRFEPAHDAHTLRTQLRRHLSRPTAYNALARVRTSRWLRVRAHHGALHTHAGPDIALALVHADSAFSATLEHAGRSAVDEREYAHVQAAVLYTSVAGERRVRVVNLALQVAALAGNVFRFADVDATVCHLAKEAVSSLSQHTLSNIRDNLTERCSSILLAYRRSCAAATSPSQLILPEAFKLLPLYILGIHKSKALRAHNVSADVRNVNAHLILTAPVHKTMRHLYPRFTALHDLPEDVAIPIPPARDSDEPPTIRLPPLIRDTYTSMVAQGVYLIDNEDVMILWLGSYVSRELLLDIFGVESLQQIDVRVAHLPHLPTLRSAQIHSVLASRTAERGGIELRVQIARQNADAAEIELGDMLVEDQNSGAMSYIDYLCFVHKQINNALTGNTSISSPSTFGMRGTPW